MALGTGSKDPVLTEVTVNGSAIAGYTQRLLECIVRTSKGLGEAKGGGMEEDTTAVRCEEGMGSMRWSREQVGDDGVWEVKVQHGWRG